MIANDRAIDNGASVRKNIAKNVRGKCQFPGHGLEEKRSNLKFETRPELVLVRGIEIKKRKGRERETIFKSR